MDRLDGRVALVTGGSRGIGRAVSLALADAGAKVAVAYASRHDDAQATQAEVAARGSEALLLPGDATDPDGAERCTAAAVERWGRLDMFVACAVQPVSAVITELTVDDWDRSMTANARGFFVGAQAAARRMGADGTGRIVALSATGAHRTGNPAYAPLAMAKGAVEAAVRYFAVALAPRGITVNAVAPGPTETEAFTAMAADKVDEVRSRLAARIPFGRLGQPEDAASVVAFLCGDGGRWVTGQTIFADGGYTL